MRRWKIHNAIVDPVVLDAYEHALRELAEFGLSVDGACLEASVLMHQYLREHGIRAELVRREIPDAGGHWTVRTPAGEYDPTIMAWDGGVPGLYTVRAESPHHEWPETKVDEARAYSMWFGT